MEANKTLIHRINKDERVFAFKSLKGQEYLDDLLFVYNSVLEEEIEPIIFSPPSVQELIESLELDKVVGVYYQNKIVAFSILIVARKDERDLSVYADYRLKDCLCFDNVLVHKDFRGYGIEKELIRLAKGYQIKHQFKHLLAVVSKLNAPSLKSFIDNDFKIIKSDIDIYNTKRELVDFELK